MVELEEKVQASEIKASGSVIYKEKYEEEWKLEWSFKVILNLTFPG